MAMAQAQAVKETTKSVTEEQSLQLVRNIIRISIFNISYCRGLFSEKHFAEKNVPALGMTINKLIPIDEESKRLIDWMEKGVYDALKNKYLKSLIFAICDKDSATDMLESYSMSFNYGRDGEVEMKLGDDRSGKVFNTSDSQEHMKGGACRLVRQLCSLMRTLEAVPENRTLVMKLYYYDEVTPEDYEPPYFRSASTGDKLSFAKMPLNIKVGALGSRHHRIALKIKSLLDPDFPDQKNGAESESMGEFQGEEADSDDENFAEDLEEAYQMQTESIAEHAVSVKQVKEDEDGTRAEIDQPADHPMCSEESQGPKVAAEALASLKAWIKSRKTRTVDFNEVLCEFPDVSASRLEGALKDLESDGTLACVEKDKYEICRQGGAATQKDDLQKQQDDDVTDDPVYLKALYHALPMQYVTLPMLQNKLGKEVTQAKVKKIVERMIADGYIEETASNKRMGRRVLRKDIDKSKLQKAFTALTVEATKKAEDETDHTAGLDAEAPELNPSTVGGLRSLGSEATRQQAAVPDLSNQTDAQPGKKTTESGKANQSDRPPPVPTRPAASTSKPRSKAKRPPSDFVFMDSQEPANEIFRKASVVADPIYQSTKRFRSEP